VFSEGVSDQVDYEGELGVVIGRRGVGIGKEEAFDYVFGYTIINDVTARDVQKRHQQWYLGKSFDTFCPMAGGGQLYVTSPESTGVVANCTRSRVKSPDARSS
jgi:2-keto-4-pentenoate hydratase/2-oxohepta-3-ene-1,7-dioic acid hydratase in catechol pathway